MKAIVLAALSVVLACAAGDAFAAKAAKACRYGDAAKMKEHFEKHVTYPAKGKDIKEACKKEMPKEFSKSERSCVDKKLKDDVEYKSAEDVYKALGITPK